MVGKTLYDKLWDDHLVLKQNDGSSLIYIDRHILHEVTSPQAFEGLKLANRKPWRLSANIATPDHNVPTTKDERDQGIKGIKDRISRLQVKTLDDNCADFNITEFKINDIRQGIVHVVGPEQGLILPGMTVVCGDSHTATHGALGCLAQGIGTSEVEHALATQCLIQTKMKNMLIRINGELRKGITAKDLALNIISQIGTAAGTGHAIEFAGEVIRNMTMESRLTVCNMAIEAGARVGLIAVDDVTVEYIRNKPYAPKGEMWQKAANSWSRLHSDIDAHFDQIIDIDAGKIEPQISWGTSPEMVVSINEPIPDPKDYQDQSKQKSIIDALDYMGLTPGDSMTSISIDKVFIGSCTNSRIEDLREAASVIKNRRIAKNIKLAMVVPGSGLVKHQAELEGLDRLFINAGFEWREPGCSMCLAMNADKLQVGERCASTSNRNFEGRQGLGSRTHLVSPAMAVAAALEGKFVDVRNY